MIKKYLSHLTIIAFGLVIRLIYAIYSHDFWLDEGVNYFIAQNRDYGLFTLLTSLMMLAFLNLVQKSNIKNLIFFILSSTVAILTHYFAILALISLIMASFLSLGFKIKLKTLFV